MGLDGTVWGGIGWDGKLWGQPSMRIQRTQMSGRSCPQEEYFFLKPLGCWPRAEPQSEGAKRQESLGSALGAPSEQPGTQGTQTRCGGTTPAQQLIEGPILRPIPERKDKSAFFRGWWTHHLRHSQEKQQLRPRQAVVVGQEKEGRRLGRVKGTKAVGWDEQVHASRAGGGDSGPR